MADQTRLTLQTRDGLLSESYADSRTKRAYDLCLATLLLVLTAPVLLPALLVNVFSTGGRPVFVQRRAGRNRKEFGLLKLRTMRKRNGGENWSYMTSVSDERLTFFGKVLRRLYIDELPQLINVLAGHMSMIGPRPETLETTEEIAENNPRFSRRMNVKPGLTGVAQIFFRKPASDHDLWRRYYYDRVYITHSSFVFDLRLTGLTILHVLRNKGH